MFQKNGEIRKGRSNDRVMVATLAFLPRVLICGLVIGFLFGAQDIQGDDATPNTLGLAKPLAGQIHHHGTGIHHSALFQYPNEPLLPRPPVHPGRRFHYHRPRNSTDQPVYWHIPQSLITNPATTQNGAPAKWWASFLGSGENALARTSPLPRRLLQEPPLLTRTIRSPLIPSGSLHLPHFLDWVLLSELGQTSPTVTPQICAGDQCSFVLKADGTVWAWGSNTNGQLGNGPGYDSEYPQQVAGLNNIVQISAEGTQVLALRSDNTLWAWGNNSDGQLGQGNYDAQNTPQQITLPVSTPILSICMSESGSAFAVLSDHTVYGWGANWIGQLGDGTTNDAPSPELITGLGNNVVAISSCYINTLAVKTDGTVWVTGWGTALGNNTTNNVAAFQIVPGLSNIAKVNSAPYSAFAVDTTGHLWVWGAGYYGNLGVDLYGGAPTPVKLSLTGVASVSGSWLHTVLLKNNGTVWVAGYGPSGQVGLGRIPFLGQFEQIPNLPLMASVCAADTDSMALTRTGTVMGWGDNQMGQLGHQDNSDVDPNTMAQMVDPNTYTAIACGAQHQIMLKNDGTVWATGYNGEGQLGQNDGLSLNTQTALQVSNITNAVAIFSGQYHNLVVDNEDNLWVWGRNYDGELGDGTTNSTDNPEIIPLHDSGITSVAGGQDHTLVAFTDGTVEAWGSNSHGQLGDGTTNGQTSPENITTIASVIQVAASSERSFALDSSGRVWAWGENSTGSLGIGTTSDSDTPVQVTGLPQITKIASFDAVTLALDVNGNVWAWGDNAYGELGNGTTQSSLVPVQVQNLSSIVNIAAGDHAGYALARDGSVWAWGSNANGQLCNGTYNDQSTPVQMVDVANIKAIAAGAGFGSVLKSDGTISGVGNSTQGNLDTALASINDTAVTIPGIFTASAAAPQVSLTDPIQGAGYGLGNTVHFQSSASSANGTIKKVIYNLGGFAVGQSTTASTYSVNWNPSTYGDFTFHATAYDSFGQVVLSGLVTFYVSDQQVPTVPSITSPISGTTTSDPQMTVSGTSVPSTVVTIYDNGQADGTPAVADANGLFSTVISLSPGKNSLQAGAVYNSPGSLQSNLSTAISVTYKPPPPPAVSSTTSATAVEGISFSYTITGTNSPTSFNAAGLPVGLSVNTSTGVISGTPTVTGTFSVTLTATNPGGTGAKTLTLTVKPQPPVITSTLTATGTPGVAFSYTITATNNPTSFKATSLPGGLSLNSTTGVISGTPASSAANKTYNVALSALNSGGTGTATLVLTINPLPPVINSTATATAVEGTSFSYTITGTNSPTSFNAAGLPAGLSVNTGTGVISGTATVTGTFAVTLSAANVSGTGTKALTLTVKPPVPVVTSALTATATTGTAFGYTITASNSPTSYNATGLPSGFTIQKTTGVISGTPATTAAGAYTVQLSATNVTGTGTATLSLVFYIPVQAPVISSARTASGTVGTTFSYTITATNAPTSFSATGLPAGLSLNPSTGVITGTPTTAGTSTVTLGATNTGGTGTTALTLTVSNPAVPVINSVTAVSGDQGAAFSYTITATNNPTSFSASGLPAGLILDSSSGLISGTPTASGTFSVSLGAANVGGTGSATLSLVVSAPTAPMISSSTSVVSLTGTSFSYTIAASNSPTSYSVVGTLPAGLTLNTSTGVISGTPTGSGSSTTTVIILATNSSGTGETTLVFNNNPPAPVITSASSATGSFGQSFNYAITASNSPTSYSITSGALPAGLILDSGSGIISGIPTAAGSSVNTSTLTIAATNAGGTGTASLTLTLNPNLAVPVISSSPMTTGDNGTSFSYAITTATQPPPTSYSATGLPAGLTLNTSTGVISGTPTKAGTYTVTISASNGSGTAVQTVKLVVNPAGAPVISSSLAPVGHVGSAFNYTITASNSPTSFSAAGLPAGLTFNTTTGVISGTPTIAGNSTVTIKATNSVGTGTTMIALTINPPPPVINSAATASGSFGVGFTPYTITASNNPVSFSATGLPPGLLLNSATGVIFGTPTMAGTYNVTLGATDAAGDTGLANLPITIGSSSQPILIRSVSAGYSQVLVLKTDGTVWAAGDGVALGQNSNVPSDVYLKVSGLPSGIVSVASGYDFSYALASDGTVWAWGDGGVGQMGNNTFNNSNLPGQVLTSNGSVLTGVVAIAAGYGDGMALCNDGTVWAWGGNGQGELGNGNNTNSAVAVEVTTTANAPLSGIVGIACGAFHELAVKSDGTVWAWGQNTENELGNGTGQNSNVALPVPHVSGIVSVTAGLAFSTGLASDGTVWAWGDQSEGYLGNGVTNATTLTSGPVHVLNANGGVLNGIVSISSQGDHTMALKGDGTVCAWGANEYGQLGNGTPDAVEPYPVVVSNLSNVVAASAGFSTNVALRNDGSIWVWGVNQNDSVLGAGAESAPNLLPAAVPSLGGITAIASNKGHSLALDLNGNVWIWGDPFPGEISDGVSIVGNNTPTQVQGLSNVTAIACGAYLNLALKNDGTVWAWGGNDGYGERGNGTTEPQLDIASANWGPAGPSTLVANQTPTQVVTSSGAPLTNIKSVACEAYSGFAIDNNGNVWSWGENDGGELGNGDSNYANTNTAAQIAGLSNITSLAAGAYFAMALDSSGNVWSWGANTYGELGNGTPNSSNVPEQVSGVSNVTAITVGFDHSLALKNDGTVWSWGLNQDGELGNGSTTNALAPAQIPSLSGITAIASGPESYHSLALKSDGTLWSWGSNQDGQLGIGILGPISGSNASPTGTKVPVQVQGLGGARITGMSCTKYGSVVLTSVGTVLHWGDNSYEPFCFAVPYQVAGPLTNPAPVITAVDGLVSISTSLTSGTIYYTLDGTQPTAHSTPYTGSLTLTGDALVSAAVFVNGAIVTPVAADQVYVNDLSETGLAAAPTGLSVIAANGQLDLSWSLSSLLDYSAINVYRSSDGGATYQLIATLSPSTTSYVDNNVQSGTNYQYMVGTLDASGIDNTVASSSISPASPTTLTITVTTPSGVTYLP